MCLKRERLNVLQKFAARVACDNKTERMNSLRSNHEILLIQQIQHSVRRILAAVNTKPKHVDFTFVIQITELYISFDSTKPACARAEFEQILFNSVADNCRPGLQFCLLD